MLTWLKRQWQQLQSDHQRIARKKEVFQEIDSLEDELDLLYEELFDLEDDD